MKVAVKLALLMSGITIAGAASADPVALSNNYISTAVGSAGTLGTGGTASPGLIHDPTGTGTFDPANDYITPGSPHQGFAVSSDQSGFLGNENAFGGGSFGTSTATALTGAALNGYTYGLSWTGGNSFLSITNNYFLNANEQRVVINSTITALQDLTGLAFVTSVDPDPDVGRFGNFATVNQRGNDVFGVNDFVGSAGAVSGLVLAILNLNANGYAHSTQINSSCCSTPNPFSVLNYTDGDVGLSGTGDFGLGLAYNIGDLMNGGSASFTYAYAVGDRIGDTGSNPDPVGGVPEPATWAMMMVGFGLVGGTLRRRRVRASLRYA